MAFLKLDLSTLFMQETNLAELILRGTVLYFGILIMLRLLPRRTGGEMATMDLIFIILIAEAAAHSLGDYTTVTDGFIVILTLVIWNFLVNLLSYHYPKIEKLVSAPPIQIIRDGKLLRRNMRKEYITEEELMDHLRKQEIEEVDQVKAAFVESEGHITVLKKKAT